MKAAALSDDMTKEDAEREAVRRWGPSGAARLRAMPNGRGRGTPGRLAPYRFLVGNGYLRSSCTILGQGHSWREAFEDARPRVAKIALNITG